MPVWCCGGTCLRTDVSAGSWSIFDQYGLAESILQVRRDQPEDGVGRSPRRIGIDQANWAVGPGLRAGEMGRRNGAGRSKCLDHGTAMHGDPFKRAAGCPGGEVGVPETGK